MPDDERKNNLIWWPFYILLGIGVGYVVRSQELGKSGGDMNPNFAMFIVAAIGIGVIGVVIGLKAKRQPLVQFWTMFIIMGLVGLL